MARRGKKSRSASGSKAPKRSSQVAATPLAALAQPYKIIIKPTAEAELAALPTQKLREQIARRIDRLRDNPKPSSSKPLKGTDFRRDRHGDHRIVYFVGNDSHTVTILRIGLRNTVYGGLGTLGR